MPEIEPIDNDEPVFDDFGPWDRLSNESTYHHQAFMHYVMLGPKRTLRDVSNDLNVNRKTVGEWASRNSWTERAEAYDDYEERKARRLLESGRIAMRNKHAEMAKDMRDKAFAAFLQMPMTLVSPKDIGYLLDLSTKLERLSLGEGTTNRLEVTGKDGGPIEHVTELTAQDRLHLLAQIQKELARSNPPELEDVIDADVVESLHDEDTA